MTARAALIALAGAVLVLAGCVPGSVLKNEDALRGPVGASRVVLMEPDVELSLVTAGGLLEPNAAWTEAGRANVDSALAAFMRERHAALIRYREPDDPSRAHLYQQIRKLHQAVGVSVLQHKYIPVLALPTKNERFDWTLGSEVRALHDEFGADYALFVFLHDSYVTPGRVAAMVVAAAFGVGLPGGVQVGFASLVDLRSGDVVWFNRLVSTTGDLRTEEPAREAIDTLLAEIPL